jgi:hypothetical protein
MEIPGKGRYHLVSMHNEDGYQSIGITKLNTNRWTVDEWHIISRPDQPWEQHMGGGAGLLATAGLNEGPYVSRYYTLEVISRKANISPTPLGSVPWR